MRSKAHLALFTMMILIPAAALASRSALDPATVISQIQAYYGNAAADSQLYLGSEACLACHKQAAGWRTSLHATGLKTVATDAMSMQTKNGIIVDYDRNGVDDFSQGLDFNRISSAFDKYKPNAPVLKYTAGKGYSITIGKVEYLVVATHGGSGLYKQRFLIKYAVTDRPGGLSAGTYYSPIQYNEATNQYVEYEPTYWYNADNTPKFSGPISAKDAAKGKSFDKGCSGCHATAVGISVDSNGEYVAVAPTVAIAPDNDPHYFDLGGVGMKQAFNIGCERCHGPGSQHVMGGGDKSKIVNPKNLTAMQQNTLCGSCHSRGASVPNGIHEFPYNEATKEAFPSYTGEGLEDYWKPAPGLWANTNVSRQHHQQFQDFKNSAKWEFAYHKVTCMDCHNVHNTNEHNIIDTMTVDGPDGATLKLSVKVEDNSLCLGCHAGFGPFQALKREQIADMQGNWLNIASVVSQHTVHPYAPEREVGLSRCTECHMAKVASSGAPYDISSHGFKVVQPKMTLDAQAKGGMPNSCAVRCHRPLAPLFGLPADTSLTNWAEPSDVALANFLQGYLEAWWPQQPQQ